MPQEKQIVFDTANSKFILVSNTDYSLIADVDLTTPVLGGIKLEVDTGSGYVTLYDNSALASTNYTVDANASPTNSTVQNVQVPIPLSDSKVLIGAYKLTTYELVTLSASTTTISVVTSFDYTEQVDVNICLSHTISCVAPLISFVDNGNYTFNGTEPTVSTGSLTLTYPTSANQTPLVDSTLPLSLSTDNVWTGSSSALASIFLVYDFDFYTETLELTAEDSVDVVCDSLCSVYNCVKKTREAINANKGVNTTKYNSLLASYTEAMSVAEQIDMAVNCGDLDSIEGLVSQIKSILNCDCSSTVSDCSSSTTSQQVLGIGNIISSGGTDLTVTDGVTDILAVDKITVGDGLLLTNPTTTEAKIELQTDAPVTVINYRDVIPQGVEKNKEALDTYTNWDLPDPATHTLLVNTATDPLVTTEFEDASQVYNPEVIEVGDKYFLYYAANTQKFTTPPINTWTGSTPTNTEQKHSDFSRIDRVFLAYRNKSEGLHGKWQKWEDGRKAVLDIGDFEAGGYDRGNVWLRSVLKNNDNDYIMYFVGDSQRNGADHVPAPAMAKSTDGINWTKLGVIPLLNNKNLSHMTYISDTNTYYIYMLNGNNIDLYKNVDPIDDAAKLSGWSLVTSSLLTTYNGIFATHFIGGDLYLIGKNGSNGSKLDLIKVAVADIEVGGSYTYQGNVITGNWDFGEKGPNLEGVIADLNYCNIVDEGNDRWSVFYAYKKDRYARTKYVTENGIRAISFTNTIPMPPV